MAISDNFVSHENKRYVFKLGNLIASGLTGFIFGVVVTSLILLLSFQFFFNS